MKNYLLTIVALFFTFTTTAQTEYEMVVEKTDGSKSVFKTADVKQTYFQKSAQEPTGIFQGAKRVFGNNLVKAFGREGQDRYEISYDANGFVTSISRTEYSEGGNYLHSWLFSYQTDGRIIMNYYRNGMLDDVYYLTVGSNGFINSIRMEQVFEATLSYDEEGHLVKVLWTDIEGDDNYTDVEAFTWMDGDLVRDNIVFHDDDDDDNSNISYISPTQTTPIENVTGVMDYYFGMGIDLEGIEQLYYIGGLGKGTKHLPMAWVNDSRSGNNVWTLDSQNRAVKMVNTRKRYDEISEQTFFWEW